VELGTGLTPHGVSSPGTSPTRLNQAADSRIPRASKQVSVDGSESHTQRPAAVEHGAFREESSAVLSHNLEGRSVWTNGCVGQLGGQSLTAGAALRLRGVVMPGVDQIRSRERDKLTVAEVCADLGISRRTFYEWRAKGTAPRCITLPNGSLRIRRSEYQRWLTAREEAA
jgi:excisionase family DNA binding protein